MGKWGRRTSRADDEDVRWHGASAVVMVVVVVVGWGDGGG